MQSDESQPTFRLNLSPPSLWTKKASQETSVKLDGKLFFSILKMGGTYSSELSVQFQLSTRRHSSEDSTLLLIMTSFVYNNFWVINYCLQQTHPPSSVSEYYGHTCLTFNALLPLVNYNSYTTNTRPVASATRTKLNIITQASVQRLIGLCYSCNIRSIACEPLRSLRVLL